MSLNIQLNAKIYIYIYAFGFSAFFLYSYEHRLLFYQVILFSLNIQEKKS